MGKNKRDYQVDEMESYGYTSNSSHSSSSSSSSGSGSSDSENSTSTERERKKKRVKKKGSKPKKEKRLKKNTSGGSEDEETENDDTREKRKRTKHAKHRSEVDERYTDDYDVRDDRKHHSSSRKHKHHRKHKHKHRHHRHHRSEERQERRREGSLERTEVRRGRDGEERKYKDRLEYDKSERERRVDKDTERKDKREERKQKDRYESRQVKSKWDEEDDTQYDANKHIKVEMDMDEDTSREQTSKRSDDDRRKHKIKKETGRSRQETDREQMSQNGRSDWGTKNNLKNLKEENSTSEEDKQKNKPNMGLSGKLTEDANTFNGVVIKYSQPPEARKPKRRWRWYIFKGEEDLPFLPLHRQSAYLIGRDRKVADIPTDHPSCSKQHAVLQYRLVAYNREDGTKGRTVKPYILDLESANGTYLNNRRIESRRFVELLEKDVVKFGYSSREYILLHEGSKGEEEHVPDTGVELSPVSILRS